MNISAHIDRHVADLRRYAGQKLLMDTEFWREITQRLLQAEGRWRREDDERQAAMRCRNETEHKPDTRSHVDQIKQDYFECTLARVPTHRQRF